MKLLTLRRIPNRLEIGFVVSAAFISIMAGTSYMFYDSLISPLLPIALVLVILFALLCVRKPVLALYATLLVVLLPIGFIPAGIHSNLNRALTVIALIVWAIYILVHQRRIVLTKTALFMLSFLIWSLLTVLWAQNLEASKYVLGGYSLRFVLFLFLIPNEINTRENSDRLMLTLAIAGWIYLISGLVTVATQGYEVGTRLRILEANENTLGGLFPILSVGVIWLAVRLPNPRRGLWTALSLLFIILSFVLIALTGSRGGSISWVITILVLLFWRQTRLWGLVGLIILASVIIIAPMLLTTTIDRFTDSSGDTLLGGREALWQAAWLLIHDRPFTGVGVGNAPSAMIKIVRFFRSVGEDNRAVVHNPVLTIWVETGLPGMLLYLAVLASSVWSFVHAYIRCRRIDVQWMMPYFFLTASGFLGYFASWIKGGGMELSFSYFLMLALLVIPAHLEITLIDISAHTERIYSRYCDNNFYNHKEM